MATMIETHGLRKSFKTRRGVVEAVKGVDLRVESGEIFGFLGPERCWQDDHDADADNPAAADERRCARCRP